MPLHDKILDILWKSDCDYPGGVTNEIITLIESQRCQWKLINKTAFIWKTECGVFYDFLPLHCPNCGNKVEKV